MMRTALMILGAALWGLLVFVIGLRVNFPSDEALARLRYEVWRSSDGKYALEASGASLAFPLSLSLSDVTVYKVDKARKTVRRHRKKNGRTDDDDVPEEEPLPKATTWLQFEQLDASIGLLDLLAGKQALTFDTELYGGDLGGTVVLGEGSTHIDIEGADIDLSTMNPSGDEWNLVLAGLEELPGRAGGGRLDRRQVGAGGLGHSALFDELKAGVGGGAAHLHGQGQQLGQGSLHHGAGDDVSLPANDEAAAGQGGHLNRGEGSRAAEEERVHAAAYPLCGAPGQGSGHVDLDRLGAGLHGPPAGRQSHHAVAGGEGTDAVAGVLGDRQGLAQAEHGGVLLHQRR
jgi:hypothetical protein